MGKGIIQIGITALIVAVQLIVIPPLGYCRETRGRKDCKVAAGRKLMAEITAYYRPEIGQQKYALGSYAADVRMNGEGVETFAGTVPGIGTAAADWSKLRKGTKFRILHCSVQVGEDPPLRVCDITFEVLDTGDAMKRSDRILKIDIFVGSGDKGREMAEKFGVKRQFIEVVECQPQK